MGSKIYFSKFSNIFIFRESNDGQTALHMATHRGHEENLYILIRNKADVNSCDEAGFSPLMLAAEIGSVSCVKQLIACNADLEVPVF